jgi:hypothetical protein
MTMAVWCSIAAAGLAALAAVVSIFDGDVLELRFFSVITMVAVAQAWAVWSQTDRHRILVVGIAFLWVFVAALIDALLVLARGSGPDLPAPAVEATYLGQPATAYHVVALHGGAILAMASALLGSRRPSRPPNG